MLSSSRSSQRTRERDRSEYKQDIRERLEKARARTWSLLEPLTDEATRKQHSPLMSPLVWDVAHIGHFEELWLVQELGKLPAINTTYDHMYDAFKNPRRDRDKLPLLDRHQCREYLTRVRGKALEHLDRVELVEDNPLTAGGFVFEMVLQHEYQHSETMLATLQLMADPGYRPILPPARGGTEMEVPMVLVAEGEFLMGTNDRRVAYDNERPEQIVWLPPFCIDTAPVSNAAYLEFIDDRGYERPELWAPAGRQWLSESGASSPQFWERRRDDWWVNTFGHWRPLNPRLPVQHVCYWEADAYARWAGKRLPTELEWEKAASWDPVRGEKRRYPWGNDLPTSELANLDQTAFSPMEIGAFPRGVSAYGCHQMLGDVWEWVSSDFTGYPGFKSFPYKEYSEVFFGPDYKVLRGGSWAVRSGAIRNTFRNWDYPIRRQIFSGFRCARDAR